MPYISVNQTEVWHGDISAAVYTPVDACVVLLTENYYAPNPAIISQTTVGANEFDTQLSIGMTRLTDTSVSIYREFCSQAAKDGYFTLYAYLYERSGGECTVPLSATDGLVFDRFELTTTDDVWSTAFCADPDVVNSD